MSKQSGIARRAGIVAFGTLISRILGALRDSVIAWKFSVGLTDAFFVAFTIPNALRQILGEGATSAAVVPMFTEIRERRGDDEARLFVRRLTSVWLLLLIVVTAAGVLGARFIVPLYASGFHNEPGKFELTVSLTRLLFPYIFFMGLAAVGMGVLNSIGKLFVPAVAPALLNISMLLAPWVFVPAALRLGLSAIEGLAIATLVGGASQQIAQWPALRSAGYLMRPVANPFRALRDPDVRRVFALLGPLVIGLSIYQVNIMLSRLFASYLPSGSQSYLYYGVRIVEIPQGMFAMAIATATLPHLSQLRARGEDAAVAKVLEQSLTLSLLISIPCSMGLIALAEPTVALLFGRGEFGPAQIENTARSLFFQAAGIWAFAITRTLVPAFHSGGDTKTHVLSSGVSLLVFIAASLALMPTMKHAGIAFGISLGAMAQCLTLAWRVLGSVPAFSWTNIRRPAVKIITSSLVMSLVARSVVTLGHWTQRGMFMRNAGIFALALFLSGVTFIICARLLKLEELTLLEARIRAKLRKQP